MRKIPLDFEDNCVKLNQRFWFQSVIFLYRVLVHYSVWCLKLKNWDLFGVPWLLLGTFEELSIKRTSARKILLTEK